MTPAHPDSFIAEISSSQPIPPDAMTSSPVLATISAVASTAGPGHAVSSHVGEYNR